MVMINKQSLKKSQDYKEALLNGDTIKIVIPLNPITKKNSSQIIYNKKTKKYIIIPSKQFIKYEKECGLFLSKYKNIKIDIPLNIKCLYYMKRRGKVDLVNLLEATDDVLVTYEVIDDDNSKIVVAHDGSRVLYDKENPRVEIYISKINE